MVGQSFTVAALRTAVASARARGDAVGHTLISGQPGLGKTTLARAVAAERGVPLRETIAPALGGVGGIVKLLVSAQKNEVLFIDEIHGLPRRACEMLYEAMEEGRISLVLTDKSRSRTVKLELPPFTLIGATTDAGLLPEPLRARFVRREHLDFYEPAELTEPIRRAAATGKAGRRAIDPRAAERLAAVSRRTPRRALRLLRCAAEEADAGGAERHRPRLCRSGAPADGDRRARA